MKQIFHIITTSIVEYFRAIFLIAVIAGLTAPAYLISWYNILTPLIIVLMYLGALDIEYYNLPSILQYWKNIIIYYVIMMIILPLLLFYGISQFSIDIATGVFLLTIAPAGIAAVAFTRLMGGNNIISLCLAVITTATLPILLPIASTYLLGNTIQIDTYQMFTDLLLFCIAPIIAAYYTQHYAPKLITIIRPHLDRTSIIMIGIMIGGPVAYNADRFLSMNPWTLLITVGGLFILSIIIHIAGRLSMSGTTKEIKIAGALSKGFMNISLATVITAKYFGPEALMIVLLYEFPRDLMLIPFKRFIKHLQ